jgi:cellulose synthase/poly-beta-1,6-N-acetylglucosamine synthase-like glycosyltransferase
LKGFEFIVFSFWSIPLILLCTTFYGYLRAKFCFKIIGGSHLTKKIIVQITTLENHNLVNKIIFNLRSYNFRIPYEIWIVTESSLLDDYLGADKIFKVPLDFRSIGNYKARALDYSSQVRKDIGITSNEYKILFLDDDTIPSKKYVEKCFIGDYDIMEGIIEPKLNYGNRYSYVDNIRTLSCMSLCSIFQSHGHPLWVHGEGICIKGSIEQQVGWKFNIIASEDLVFGHACATKKLKWGFIWEPVYITSPWNFKDFIRQRKRWLWGNVDALLRILTWKSKIRIVFFYVIGAAALVISTMSTIMDQLRILNFSITEREVLYISLISWLAIYGYIGYIVGDRKLRHILASMGLAWYASFMNTLPIWIGLFLSRPKRFEVIAKESIRRQRITDEEKEKSNEREI